MKTLVASMDGKGPAEALYAVAELQKEVGRTEASLVRKARQAGLSWEAIALCLGVSPSTANTESSKSGQRLDWLPGARQARASQPQLQRVFVQCPGIHGRVHVAA